MNAKKHPKGVIKGKLVNLVFAVDGQSAFELLTDSQYDKIISDLTRDHDKDADFSRVYMAEIPPGSQMERHRAVTVPLILNDGPAALLLVNAAQLKLPDYHIDRRELTIDINHEWDHVRQWLSNEPFFEYCQNLELDFQKAMADTHEFALKLRALAEKKGLHVDYFAMAAGLGHTDAEAANVMKELYHDLGGSDRETMRLLQRFGKGVVSRKDVMHTLYDKDVSTYFFFDPSEKTFRNLLAHKQLQDFFRKVIQMKGYRVDASAETTTVAQKYLKANATRYALAVEKTFTIEPVPYLRSGEHTPMFESFEYAQDSMHLMALAQQLKIGLENSGLTEHQALRFIEEYGQTPWDLARLTEREDLTKLVVSFKRRHGV